jgi:serine/threonine protein phosphatase 1
LLERVRPDPEDQLVFVGDYIDRGPESGAVVDRLLELAKERPAVFLRGNHEVMVLAAREEPASADLWRSSGGLAALASYGAEFRDDWAAAIPASHWAFFESTARFFETAQHIFVHGCLDPELDLDAQPDWLLFWEGVDRMQPHKSGKRVVCGHTPQHSGRIRDLGFAVCIDTAAVTGGWLSCLDVDSGKFWQANERAQTREGRL